MLPSLLLFIFNICLLINLTLSINNNHILQLSVYPHFGFTTENIEVRCQIFEASRYDNVYLSVRTDNVIPSGILLMVDNTVNECRRNKEKNIQVNVCNSSLIHIYINHIILNDSIHTIDYVCSQGDVNVINSYRIMKEQKVLYYDPKYLNSSSSLTYTPFLLLFILIITRIRTIEEIRWLLNEHIIFIKSLLV